MAEELDQAAENAPVVAPKSSRRTFVRTVGTMAFVAAVADVVHTVLAVNPCGNGTSDSSCWVPGNPLPATQDGNCGTNVSKNSVDAACNQSNGTPGVIVPDNSCGKQSTGNRLNDASCGAMDSPTHKHLDGNCTFTG